MPKTIKPIEFTHTARNRYTCFGGSEDNHTYYLTLSDDNRATCTCLGFAYRQRCKHSKQLEETSLYEPKPTHSVTVTDMTVGTNYHVKCACGWEANVATLNRGFADEIARNHLEAQLPQRREVTESPFPTDHDFEFSSYAAAGLCGGSGKQADVVTLGQQADRPKSAGRCPVCGKWYGLLTDNKLPVHWFSRER